MHGNLFECCLDHWYDNYGNAPINGSTWIDKMLELPPAERFETVVNTRNYRAAYRIYNDNEHYFVGFRVVCCAPRTLT